MVVRNSALNAKEAAAFLGGHVETIRRLARRGDIPAYKIGKDWRFRREAILRWAEEHHLRRKPLCVLAVDDDPIVRKLITRLLEPEGFQVVTAGSGMDALAYLEKESVDLILLDLKMPEMNGAECLAELRKTDPDLPVIFITGYPDSELVVKAMRYGPFMLLAKPIDNEHLIRSVKRELNGRIEKRRSDRETAR